MAGNTRQKGAWEWLEESPEHIRDQKEWDEIISQAKAHKASPRGPHGYREGSEAG